MSGVAPLTARVASALRRSSLPLLLLLFGAIQLGALVGFTSGFFLTRFELPGHQTCAVPLTQQHRVDAARRLQSPATTPATAATAAATAADGSDADGASCAAHGAALLPASCWYPRQYDRVVILLIDALRFDFLLHNETAVREATEAAAAAAIAAAASAPSGSASSFDPSYLPFENGLPVVERLLRSPSRGAHALLYRFEADPPTVTMQRLKGMTTGGLPTFIDIKDNFASSAIAEDNWIWQLVHSRKGEAARTSGFTAAAPSPSPSSPPQTRANRMHFFGDDTWFDLYPASAHFTNSSRAFPSFNVKDLHTVDDGCLANLAPLLHGQHRRIEAQMRQIRGDEPVSSSSTPDPDSAPVPSSDLDDWDVTLAHFLGVDHVGHRFGPSHPAMRPKLAQMNRAMEDMVQFIEAQRGLNEEIRRVRAERERERDAAPDDDGTPRQLPPLPAEEEVLLLVMGDHGMTPGGNHGGQSPEEIYAGLFAYSTRPIAQSGAGAASGDEGRVLEELRSSVSSSASSSSPASPSSFPLPPLSPLATSYATVPQVDLVPTLSLLLGLPIPFGSVGKVIPEFFWGRQTQPPRGDSSAAAARSPAVDDESTDARVVALRSRVLGFLPLLRALYLNALQLWQYLSVYSTLQSGSFTPQELEGLSALFRGGEESWTALLARTGADGGSGSGSTEDRVASLVDQGELQELERLCVSSARSFYSFLSRGATLARSKWTTFDMGAMGRGLGLLLLVVLVRAGYEVNVAAIDAIVRVHGQTVGARFAHPAVALSKLLALLLLALFLPLHLFSLLASGDPDDDVAQFVRSHRVFLAGAGACVAALVALVWNLSKKMTRLCAGAAAAAGPKGLLPGLRLSFFVLKSSIADASFDQFACVLVWLLYVQGLFSNSFIINEAGVALYSAAIIAASWLFGSGRAPSLSGSAASSAPSASWSNVVRVLVLLLSLRGMAWCSYSTAPDSGFQDDSKYGPVDLVLMAGALACLPVVGAAVARQIWTALHSATKKTAGQVGGPTATVTGTRLLALVHFVIYPLGCLCIFLFWTLQNAAPTATPAETVASQADGSGDAGVPSSSSPVLSALLVLASTILRTPLWPLQLSEVQLAWVVRVLLPRIVYASAAGGLMLVVCLPARIRSAGAASAKHGDASAPSNSKSSNSDSSSGSINVPAEESVELMTEQPHAPAADGITRRRKEHASSSHDAATSAPAWGPSTSAAAAAVADAAVVSSLASAHSHLFALQALSLCSLLSLPLMLVWGPKSSVLVVLLAVVTACMVQLRPAAPGASSPLLSSRLSLSELCFVFFLSLHVFYCSGHALSFSSLQVSCAFIGFDEFSYYVSGALLMLNTFGCVVVACAVVVAVAAFRNACDDQRGLALGDHGHDDKNASLAAAAGGGGGGCVPSISSPPYSSSTRALSVLSFLFLFRSSCSVFNVLLQRRHLMVWAIFAPKFIFDAVAGVVADVTVVAVVAACTRWTDAHRHRPEPRS